MLFCIFVCKYIFERHLVLSEYYGKGFVVVLLILNVFQVVILNFLKVKIINDAREAFFEERKKILFWLVSYSYGQLL